MSQRLQKILGFYMPLGVIMFFIIGPIYWIFTLSIKREADIIKTPISYIANPATLENLKMAWTEVGFYQFIKNSFIVSFVAVLFIVLFALLVGYALSRFNFRSKKGVMLILLATQFIPPSMLLIPLFQMYKHMGMINNFSSLILSYITFQLPFNSIIMKGFISAIPDTLEEAAIIDGCSRTKAIFKVIVPILLPGIVATGAFAFIGCWNEFLFGLMFINDSKKFTLPVGLSYMMGQFDINYGALAAGSVIAFLPPLMLFIYAQKYLVTGLSAGAVKG